MNNSFVNKHFDSLDLFENFDSEHFQSSFSPQHQLAALDEPHVPATPSFLSKYQLPVPQGLNATRGDISLDNSYQPSDYDVVCGRGKGSYNRPGNRRFRQIIKEQIPAYLKARTKFDKSTVLSNIIDIIKSQNNNTTRFVKFNAKSKTWVEINDDVAREKVGHTMRETIALMKKQEEDAQDSPSAFAGPMTRRRSSLLEQQSILLNQQRAAIDKLIETTKQSACQCGSPERRASTRSSISKKAAMAA